MPYSSIFDQTSRTAFQVTPLQDTLGEGYEYIDFEIVKGDRYTIDPNNHAVLTIKDATPLVVDTLVDESDGDFSLGDVSLREVIENALSGDAISFAPELQGTITLNSELLINKNLTINGSGVDRISLSGNNTSRVFEIASGTNVTLKGLSITNGFANNDSGGGIENFGNLTIAESKITNNQAVYGGGIHNTGTLVINNSTIANNRATYDGGGIYIDLGTVSLSNTTVSGNQAANDGGGLYQVGGSGSLYNTTVSGNQANNGGGIYQGGGSLVINQGTIANNTATTAGSGIYHYRDLTGGTTRVKNTIIAGNQTVSNNIGDFYGTASSLGNNLIGNATGSNGFEIDLRGFYNSPLDPKLGALQNNGGSTQTHALLAGSPALNAAAQGDSPADQRGLAVQDGRRDIGAFELIPPAVLLPGTSIIGEIPTTPIMTLPIAETPTTPGIPIALAIEETSPFPTTVFGLQKNEGSPV